MPSMGEVFQVKEIKNLLPPNSQLLTPNPIKHPSAAMSAPPTPTQSQRQAIENPTPHLLQSRPSNVIRQGSKNSSPFSSMGDLPAPTKQSSATSSTTTSISDSSSSSSSVTPHARPLETCGTFAQSTNSPSDRVVLVFCGLPATGKTSTSRRIVSYLEFFLDIPGKIFNVGDYRRSMWGAELPAEFYDPDNVEGARQREECAEKALGDLCDFIGDKNTEGVRVGVFDATNSTLERRERLRERLKPLGCKIVYVELICTDEVLLQENIRAVKLNTPDYRDANPEDAVKDFNERRRNYAKSYATLGDDEGSYIKVYDCKKFVVHDVRGYLPMKIAHFIMNLHTLPRTFYFTRHGQSEYNVLGKIGGDSSLSAAGVEYSKR